MLLPHNLYYVLMLLMVVSSIYYVYITSRHSSSFENDYQNQLEVQFIEQDSQIRVSKSPQMLLNDTSNIIPYDHPNYQTNHRICAFVPTTSIDGRHFREAVNVANTWAVNDTKVYFVFDTMDLNHTNLTQKFCATKAHGPTNQHECIFVENRKGGGFLARKTILMFKHITLNVDKYKSHCDWFLKTDTDSFVLLKEFYESALSCVDHNVPIYMGDVRGQEPILDTWPHKMYGFAAGKGYVLSLGLIEKFAQNITVFDECFNVLGGYWKHEDATIGFCIRWKMDLIVWQSNWWMPRHFNETRLLYDETKYPPNIDKKLISIKNNDSVIMTNLPEFGMVDKELKGKLFKFSKYHEPKNYLLCIFIHHMHRHKNKRIMYEIDAKYRMLQKFEYRIRYNVLNLTFRNFCVSRDFIRKEVYKRKGQGEILNQIQNGQCKDEYQRYENFLIG